VKKEKEKDGWGGGGVGGVGRCNLLSLPIVDIGLEIYQHFTDTTKEKSLYTK